MAIAQASFQQLKKQHIITCLAKEKTENSLKNRRPHTFLDTVNKTASGTIVNRI